MRKIEDNGQIATEEVKEKDMSDLANRSSLPPGEVTKTDIGSSAPGRASSMPRLQCKLAAISSGLRLTGEIAPLLRSRLRLGTLITVTAFAVFLIRTIAFPLPNGSGLAPVLAAQALVVAVMVLLTAILWTSWHLSVTALRAIELTLFGVSAAYFIYLHYAMVASGEILKWADTNFQGNIAAMATKAYNLHWLILIVIYGTFVPNTWKRCATVVGILAAIPIMLTLSSCTICPHMSPVAGPLPLVDTCILMGLASAIAIFGSYKLSSLQREAKVARELGQYRLKQKLGSGGMGEVYLGEHMMLRRKCAIKLIRTDQASDPTILERFEREVQSMAALTHPNTVEVFDYGLSEDGTFYYAMEFLPGLSLQELVDKFGPLPADRSVHFLRQVCSALQEAHTTGLIHRDIKPSNVIACERGGAFDTAKLLDFGLVHHVGLGPDDHKLTVQGVILGSPPFMSPEQALGRANIDARTDIYSVGALAYYLLTGLPPFVRETPMEFLVAHAHEKPAPVCDIRPDVPDDLQAIVMRCLEKDPNKRYSTAEELEDALAECSCADLWTKRCAARWWKESAATHTRPRATVHG
jgi:eukaryotic-like serine/threonine-protein kinase